MAERPEANQNDPVRLRLASKLGRDRSFNPNSTQNGDNAADHESKGFRFRRLLKRDAGQQNKRGNPVRGAGGKEREQVAVAVRLVRSEEERLVLPASETVTDVVQDGCVHGFVSEGHLPLFRGRSVIRVLLCSRPPEAEFILRAGDNIVNHLRDRSNFESTISADKVPAVRATCRQAVG